MRCRRKSAWGTSAFRATIPITWRSIWPFALGPQHLMQTVAPFAAEDANGQIERHVIGMVARNADVPHADFRLHRIGFVDDDHAARRIRRLDEPLARHFARLPV